MIRHVITTVIPSQHQTQVAIGVWEVADGDNWPEGWVVETHYLGINYSLARTKRPGEHTSPGCAPTVARFDTSCDAFRYYTELLRPMLDEHGPVNTIFFANAANSKPKE